jgi:hypothetical protein
MEAKKGFIAILIIVSACLFLCAGIAVVGWKAIGETVYQNLSSYAEALEENYIDVEREELEQYLLGEDIVCEKDESVSVMEFDIYDCHTESRNEDVDFRITYYRKSQKPMSIVIGILNSNDLEKNEGAVRVLEAAAGIPFRGADPEESIGWIRRCMQITDFDEMMITKNVSDISYRLYNVQNNGFTLSISRKMEYGLDFSDDD